MRSSPPCQGEHNEQDDLPRQGAGAPPLGNGTYLAPGNAGPHRRSESSEGTGAASRVSTGPDPRSGSYRMGALAAASASSGICAWVFSGMAGDVMSAPVLP